MPERKFIPTEGVDELVARAGAGHIYACATVGRCIEPKLQQATVWIVVGGSRGMGGGRVDGW
jgi:hypothetical protein